jgi:hypothetical protein
MSWVRRDGQKWWCVEWRELPQFRRPLRRSLKTGTQQGPGLRPLNSGFLVDPAECKAGYPRRRGFRQGDSGGLTFQEE